MITKEVAQICGVTEKTVRENAKTFGKVFENGKPTEWTEEELKKVQLVLMKNQISQGSETISGVVESNLYNDVQVGLTFQEIVNSGNIEAMKELTTFAMNACTTVFQLGTLANVALTSGNIEAAEQFSKLLIQATTAACVDEKPSKSRDTSFHSKINSGNRFPKWSYYSRTHTFWKC